MKNRATLSLVLILALFTGANAAQAKDVNPPTLKRGARYVQVTQKYQMVRFEDCLYEIEGSCRLIGGKEFKVSDLKSQRSVEHMQIILSAVGDVGVVISSFYLIGVSAGLLTSVAGASDILAGTAVGAGTIGGTAATVALVDALNPYEQYQQRETLADAVIADQNVIAEDMETFIERLTLVLSKI